MSEVVAKVKSILKNHHKFREKCLNLIAAENVTSHIVREPVISDFMHRYSEYVNEDFENRWDAGSKYIIEIEKMTRDLAIKVFDAYYVDLRAVSGQIAAINAIDTFAQANSGVFETHVKDGGHEWFSFAYGRTINYKPHFFPFDYEEFNIDIDEAAKMIRKVGPSLLILGASFYIFPHPVEELKEIADEVGAKILYDGAHVMGLIAGKQWPNPLARGADVLTGSTHKTFPGPQKGLVMTNNEEYFKDLGNHLYPAFVTNHHLMNVAALCIALAEFEVYGELYSRQIVKNAKALGSSLSEEGFEIIGENNGFTRSHQVLPLTSKYMRGARACI